MANITWTRRGNFLRLFFDHFSTSLSAVDFTRGIFLRSSAKNTSQFWFYFTNFSYSFVRQPEMRLYEIVGLVLALCLVTYTKAESAKMGTETLRGEETFPRDTNLDSTQTRDLSSYLKEDPEKTAEEDPKIPTKKDAREDIRKRLFNRPRPLYLTINVPTNYNVRFFQVSYCFRRSCYGKRIVIRYLSLVLFCRTLQDQRI